MCSDHDSLVERYEELRDQFDKIMTTFELINISTISADRCLLYKNYIGLVLYVNSTKYNLYYNHIEFVAKRKRHNMWVSDLNIIPHLCIINKSLEVCLAHILISHTITIDHTF